MKLSKGVSWIIIGTIVLCFALACGPRESSATLVNVGETVTWQFDFGSTDLTQYFSMGHYTNGSNPAPAPELIGFSGTVSLYDELGVTPIFEETLSGSPPDGIFAAMFSLLSDTSFRPGLFDDPISYLSIAVTGLEGTGNSSLDQADFSPFATAFDILGIENVTVWGVETSTAPVPEPATMLLLGAGLLGLAGVRRKFRNK